ncbi:MAG: Ppx/GppA phosphatase family protein [Planctomycetota bacterium]|nr:Ppx/GppA phosphatase family protein [Planctomycetota bacterium]
MPVLAVIDVGSNSVRLRVARVKGGRVGESLVERREPTRLARGLSRTGRLSWDAMADSAAAIARFVEEAKQLGAVSTRVVATAAVRDSVNGSDFIELVRREAGVELAIVPALDEARLSYRGVASALALDRGPSVVADIGGGSLEVVQAVNGVIFHAVSVPLGAVRLTEQFTRTTRANLRDNARPSSRTSSGPEPQTSGAGDVDLVALEAHVRSVLASVIQPPVRFPTLVGTGGTFSAVSWMSRARVARSAGASTRAQSRTLHVPASVETVSRAKVASILRVLRATPLAERAKIPGLLPDRVDIILAGVVVIHELMRLLRVPRLVSHDGGLRDGVLLDMAMAAPRRKARKRTNSDRASEANLRAAVRAFAERARYERPHSEHVAKLAANLFDQLDEHGLLDAKRSRTGPGSGAGAKAARARERALLHAAAVLHDIGTAVEYRRHHKHSRDMIRMSGLDSVLTRRELEIVAQVARHHRKTAPCPEHEDFAAMSEEDQRVVRRLAAVLRIADGLDRTHEQRVAGVRVVVDGKVCRVVARAARTRARSGKARGVKPPSPPLAQEVAAAQKKADGLRALIGLRVGVEAQ